MSTRQRILLVSIIALLAIAPYAQEKDTVQVEPKIKLELVWEKEIPAGINDIVFLDENGYNVFSSQCKNPEKAIKEMKMLLLSGKKVKLVSGEDFKVVKEIDFLPHSRVAISKNGRNIAVIEHIISDTIPEAKLQWYLGVIKTTVRLFNWKLEELARIDYGSPYAEIFAIGNDSTVVLVNSGEDGSCTHITVLTKIGNTFKRVYGLNEGVYPTGLFDYAEDGSTIFFIYTDPSTPVDGVKNVGDRIVVDGNGKEMLRYSYQHPGWAGWVSPKGNYLAEVTRGKYLVIRNKDGQLIAEHHVQGQGNYYAAFSPDEKYLCVTPGFRKIYSFETKTGNLVWEYKYPDDRPCFFPGDVASEGRLTFMIFTPSKQENKWIWVFDRDGKIIDKIGPLDFTGYNLAVSYIARTQQLLIKLPSKLLLYHIVKEGGGR